MTLEQNRIYVTVDVLPLSVYEGTLYILLSRRKDPPYQERWALPGRFVDAGMSTASLSRTEPIRWKRRRFSWTLCWM